MNAPADTAEALDDTPPAPNPPPASGPPTLVGGRRRVRRLALAVLGLSYIAAFGSFMVQFEGLVGAEGISPAADLLERAAAGVAQSGDNRWIALPSIAWLIGASDAALRAMCVGGMICGGLLVGGLVPRLAIAGGWALYLSLFALGGPFLSYQWDILLLEVSFVAFIYAPAGWRPRPKNGEAEPTTAGVWLMRLLLFKLMLMSGAVKLTSGDTTWQDLTALDFHYWTQPIPHPVAWYAHNAPEWTRTFGVLSNHFAELFAPWLILFAPRGWRLLVWVVACVGILVVGAGDLGAGHVLLAGLVTVILGWTDRHRSRWPAVAIFAGLMLSIAGTGNYGFFHLLTLVLVITTLHDGDLARLVPARWRRPLDLGAIAHRRTRVIAWLVAVIILPLSATQMTLRLGGGPIRAAGIADAQGEATTLQSALAFVGRNGRAVAHRIAPIRSINGYGLFARMTTTRYELIVEGTMDGQTWLPYGFTYKPDAPDDPLRFAGLHMPRLDWQMWFGALRPRCRGGWEAGFIKALLEGSPSVRALLDVDPFPDAPPRAIRISRVDTRFTTPEERASTHEVWVFEPVRDWCPALTIEAFRQGEDG